MARPYSNAWDSGQDHSANPLRLVRFISYSDEISSVPYLSWLWKPFLVSGTLAILEGDPGVGKSLIAIDLLSRLTDNRPMPDGSRHDLEPSRPTILVNGDDSHERVLIPRFRAAGCPAERSYLFGGLSEIPKYKGSDPMGPAQFPRDFPAFHQLVRNSHPSLVVIDPLTVTFASSISTRNDQGMRDVLTEFAKLAVQMKTCILFVRHLTKKSNDDGLYRGAGTIAVNAAARTVLRVSADRYHPGHGTLELIKGIYSSQDTRFNFRIATKPQYLSHPHGPPAPLPPVPVIEWLGPSDDSQRSADSSNTPNSGKLANQSEPLSPLEQAANWLRETLSQGPQRQKDLTANALAAGISPTTLYRAKRLLHIRSRQRHDSQTQWHEWELRS